MYSPCTFGSIFAADVGSFFSVDYCEGRLFSLVLMLLLLLLLILILKQTCTVS